MDQETALNARRALVEAVALLAASGEAQSAWLSNLGTTPSADELGLEFDDWYLLLPQLEAIGLVSAAASRVTHDLSVALAAISPDDWTEDALTQSPAWAEVRRFAGMALVALLESSPERQSAYVRAAS